ncbi:Acetyltransferase (GNAT) family protein [Bacillus sp. THAF10]|uniref:GNAT family N-acetyltransferase n=1 Tax=Bacillus sp. THAF10 TaxID=2587848 RepID=UPI0012692F4E|nr:GNAT family N-acetyltransferase [Bacillus sp. THAF10]QFT90894.1 Acetyltransferase (GNAT) family protein [Bacillus sp. THAF10]
MNNLSLVKYDENDFPFYYALVSNEMVMKQITERAIPLDEAKNNYTNILEKNARSDVFGSYKVFDSNSYIGLAHLTLNANQPTEAEIGYMLLPEFWGKGYGSTIAHLLVAKASNLDIKTLTAIIDPDNIASKKILTKQGFHTEKVTSLDGLPAEYLKKTI